MLRSVLSPLIALLLLALAVPAAAQEPPVTLDETSPRAKAVLETGMPGTITLTFSDPPDPAASTVRVLAESGEPVAGVAVDWDGATATLRMPPDLPNSTWLVAWSVTSADGAAGSGFYGFTVGLDQDVAPLTLPETGFDTPSGPAWLARIATGAVVLGVLVLIALWPVRQLAATTAALRRRLALLASIAAVLAVTGALGRLAAAAWQSPAASWLGGLRAVLTGWHPGGVLLVLIALVSAHAALLALLPPLPRGALRLLPWLSTSALAVALAALGHAATEPAGVLPAVATAAVVLLALGLLGGGAITLAWLRVAPPRRAGLATAAIVPALLLGSGYLAWLFVGSPGALTETRYGSLAAIAAGLGLALVVALAVTLRGSGRTLPLAGVLGVALAVVLGAMLVEPTGRATLAQDTTQRALPFEIAGDRAQLILAPGAAGVNHVRLELDRLSIPQDTLATMTLARPDQPDLGTQTVPLSRVSGTAFEYHGAELAIAGPWDLTVTLVEHGAPTAAALALDLPADRTPVDAPATPWRFEAVAGTSGVLLAALGVIAVVVGIAAGRSPLRLEATGLGVTAVVLAAILLGQGRLDPILAEGGTAGAIDADDLTLITRGAEIYATSCLTCHGADLRGDGPAASGMQPPPADFSAPHTRVHDEATLIYWLRNGKQGTAMPAFGDILTDEEIRAVLSYIEREQRAFDGTPTP